MSSGNRCLGKLKRIHLRSGSEIFQLEKKTNGVPSLERIPRLEHNVLDADPRRKGSRHLIAFQQSHNSNQSSRAHASEMLIFLFELYFGCDWARIENRNQSSGQRSN